ncbi:MULTISPECIES: HAD family hydrolase [Lacticaseibacillus]|uniref:HAD family hydrolase n=3 Tax=Lacticaseibacillus zeae TaxID=57037 RepID=A0A5R8M2M4_LACZE|nr:MULTISPECIES: HAD family hydrolase [Lacticaseibacillus]OFR95443.1 HAD family hydrolase [Lactobacillus sp. HMSC068F07]KLI76327.1 HAD family hydrolase [Lacticaseibacillus casei]KRK13892.1 sugar phosphatase of HAD family protein [Lacticaseibacillus zeae DSM 20178 = KCTC 3804]MDE3315003.1 HAD family hydrolase [Lacticaseibacillus zeae]OLS09651.1 HAD family hydrolase [Lacticaseibacillus casei]
MTATVIFDLDGTLVDTEAIYLQSNVRAAAELGLKRTEDDFRPLVGSAGPNEAKIIADLVGAENAAWFQEFSTKDVLDRIRNGADFVLPGADEALRTLRAAHYRLALATSSAQHYVDVVLAAAGWQDWFDPILTGSDVKAHKPDPEVYQVMKRHLGAGPAIVIEDTHVGVAAAEGAGLPVIMIPGIAQQPDEKATAILSAITELPNWLQKHTTFA